MAIAAVHWMAGIALVCNIFYNYAMCVFTNPSNTLLADNAVRADGPILPIIPVMPGSGLYAKHAVS